jgi:hypothetical protein
MRCNGLLGLCKFYVFWFVLHAGCELTTPDPQPSFLDCQKFCNQKTGTNLHTQERNKRFSTLQLLNNDVLSSTFCRVLVGAICHVLLFVSFSLAPYLSLPELVLVRMYTFLGALNPSPPTPEDHHSQGWLPVRSVGRRITSSTSHIHIIHHHDESLPL